MCFQYRFTLWPLAAGVLALALADSVCAEVYKWVDEKGVVNYSSTPPPGRKAIELPKDASGVSVVPALPPMPAATRAAAVDPRIDRLERELAAERDARQAREQAAEDSRLAAIAQCEESRGVDCEENPYQYDSGGYAGGYAGGYFYPGRPFVRHHLNTMPLPKPLPVFRHTPPPRPPVVHQGALLKD